MLHMHPTLDYGTQKRSIIEIINLYSKIRDCNDFLVVNINKSKLNIQFTKHQLGPRIHLIDRELNSELRYNF